MIRYENMPEKGSRIAFFFNYYANRLRTWYLFHFVYPWVKYKGFVRVRHNTEFCKGMEVSVGDCVQFGSYNEIACNVRLGNHILIGSGVRFVGRHDHRIDIPGTTVWSSPRGESGTVVVDDDVWIGSSSVILSGVTIGKGAIIGAGSVVTHDIPPSEIWAGNPARKIRDRFQDKESTLRHLSSL